eukprot:TRINITY_DN274_c0_g1_i4.p6 TRINITY_DN274_c0_g1~~TRINITY_DN274_c0_g1_i4.p6  ORF type:complete len:109 (-),score=10.64 TRINITY_DN274_c0_g1_i4:1036-1362(-)
MMVTWLGKSQGYAERVLSMDYKLQGILQAIDLYKRPTNQATYTDLGLDMAGDESAKTRDVSRTCGTVMVITDGASTCSANTLTSATKLKSLSGHYRCGQRNGFQSKCS